jgi:hypothetical protein
MRQKVLNILKKRKLITKLQEIGVNSQLKADLVSNIKIP